MAGSNSWCPFYRGVHLIEVSIKRELTVKSTPSKMNTFGTGTMSPS